MNQDGTVAFRAGHVVGVNGVFVGDGTAVAAIAGEEDGWSGFHGLPLIDGRGTVVFRADRDDGVQGIYSSHEGTVRTVAETGDIFETLAPFPSVNDSGTVAFAATLRGGGGAIVTVKDGRSTVIDTEGAFESFRGALIDGAGSVVRIATPRGGSLGLFAGPDPEGDRILAIGDDLLGSTVAEVASNPVSINGPGQLAVRVRLTDGRQLILRTNPPTDSERSRSARHSSGGAR